MKKIYCSSCDKKVEVKICSYNPDDPESDLIYQCTFCGNPLAFV